MQIIEMEISQRNFLARNIPVLVFSERENASLRINLFVYLLAMVLKTTEQHSNSNGNKSVEIFS